MSTTRRPDRGALVAAAFSPEGALAPAWPGFEPRDGQRLMAQAVGDVLETGGTILAEAGTGTGKTLAYLIPTILEPPARAGLHRHQEPAGADLLQGPPRDCLGARRALHGHADERPVELPVPAPASQTCRRRRTRRHCSTAAAATTRSAPCSCRSSPSGPHATTTGDRAELRDLPEDLPLWGQISAEAETCLGAECPRYNDCFVTLMRQRAAESDVVIVNHHLLCADAAVRHGSFGEVIPSCPTLVVDEAHQLEDVATNYFGVTFSNLPRRRTGARRRPGAVRGPCRAAAESKIGQWTLRQIEDIARAVARVSEHSRRFFDEIGVARSLNGVSTEARIRYTAATMAEPLESGLALAGALEGVEAALALAQQATPTPDPELSAQAETLGRRAGELHQDLRVLLRGDDPDLVYALETRGRGVFLRASPVDVSRLVREAVFDRFRTVVLTSATLAVDNSFDYVKGRLGIRAADELRVPSEFDYERQALIYLPRRMPAPKSPDSPTRWRARPSRSCGGRRGARSCSSRATPCCAPCSRRRGGARSFRCWCRARRPGPRCSSEFRIHAERGAAGHVQLLAGRGRGGRRAELRRDRQAALRVPSDPMTSARIDAINARGGDAFGDYQVPLAILALQQGLGRLIRHRQDRGVLAVLDPADSARPATDGGFWPAFPPAPVTQISMR